ncbi:MAG: hypothetical protein AVDCRST_MAG13-1052 [uncultured Solirubrobacteraceae bacterium]|uniref:Cache domain-containing protein n=1 Tax=uncultured Solirubrobacteraceae bacterium TaxID=1162706 RepID=A0A6J4RYK7_9ACTN|nr:MAG: hypothetical protein AVDCRST_MAG13-1052 [uncultured Solirubrobacteraceae bacterium]
MPRTVLAHRLEDAARGALADVVGALAAPRRTVEKTAGAFGRAVAAARAEERGVVRADLDALAPGLRAALAELPAGVDGIGVVTQPGLVAGEGPWLEWWRRAAGGAVERLEVTFDPDHPADFDYPEAEWFHVPRDRGIPWIAGPFVDRGGTNRHLCTLSVPVRDGAGAFLGIAGADLRVGYLERLARRALPAWEGHCALVVTREARVLAADDPRWAAGTLLEDETAALLRDGSEPGDELRRRGGAVTWEEELPWGVAIVPRDLLSAPAR